MYPYKSVWIINSLIFGGISVDFKINCIDHIFYRELWTGVINSFKLYWIHWIINCLLWSYWLLHYLGTKRRDYCTNIKKGTGKLQTGKLLAFVYILDYLFNLECKEWHCPNDMHIYLVQILFLETFFKKTILPSWSWRLPPVQLWPTSHNT